MQGVKLVRTPATKSSGIAVQGLDERRAMICAWSMRVRQYYSQGGRSEPIVRAAGRTVVASDSVM
jgi:hypothetical protein